MNTANFRFVRQLRTAGEPQIPVLMWAIDAIHGDACVLGAMIWKHFFGDGLRLLRARNIPIVSVFLSGRPMWVNSEIDAADAFVAAFLPGSERVADGGGN